MMTLDELIVKVKRRLKYHYTLVLESRRIQAYARQVAAQEPAVSKGQPVVFFNASTRIGENSINAGISLVASWALRLRGVPVVHFVCQAGMSRCVLGTREEDPEAGMPCAACLRKSRSNFAGAQARWFQYFKDAALADAIEGLDLQTLAAYEHPADALGLEDRIPLGRLVLPALRWRLRRHTLADDPATRLLLREFILSAWNVAREFNRLLADTRPLAVVVFNGQFFPEATVKWLSQQRGIRVISHEVGLRPLSGYFTDGEATAYPIDIPPGFELDDRQNARLDAYLQDRFQGQFTMAGIRFWPEMKGFDAALVEKAAQFSQFVPVFTNVIFDTSQPHSNLLYSDMFAWLDDVLEAVKRHPDTLFVIRAHPDEVRPGKASRESVAGWVESRSATSLPNLVFVPPDEHISSYEMIRRAKFVMIYNSTIGLEASIMGVPVLSAGKARFTAYPTVFFPPTREAYLSRLEEFLSAGSVAALPEHGQHARRFLYYQLFKTSLPFGDFLSTASHYPSFVHFKQFALERLQPGKHEVIDTIMEGLLDDGNFLLKG